MTTVERRLIPDKVREALEAITGTEVKPLVLGREKSPLIVLGNGVMISVKPITPVVLLWEAHGLRYPPQIRSSMAFLSPVVSVDPNSGSVLIKGKELGGQEQEAEIHSGGGIVFRPEYSPSLGRK